MVFRHGLGHGVVFRDICQIPDSHFGGLVFNPGGKHGLFCVQQLENIVGPPGLTAILMVVAIAFLTYLSAETITVIRKALNPIGYISSKVKFTITNHQKTSGGDSTDESETTVQDEQEEKLYPLHEEEAPVEIDLTDVGTPNVSMAGNDISPENAVADTNLGNPEANPERNDDIGIKITPTQENEKAKGVILDNFNALDAPINPREPFTRYKFPSLDLLKSMITMTNRILTSKSR